MSKLVLMIVLLNGNSIYEEKMPFAKCAAYVAAAELLNKQNVSVECKST